MSSITTHFGRAPTLMFSQASAQTMNRTQLSMHRIHNQLTTGIAVSRFSDDAVKAAAISVLNERIERAGQRHRNLSHADTSLSALDQALGDASELAQEARSIASAQANATSSAGERQSQAHVVDSLIQSLMGIANRKSVAGHIFGGSTPGSPAVTGLLGGYRYMGSGPGLLTDLGIGSDVPITLGAGNIIGATSRRIEGAVDLRPVLTPDTQLTELGGARSMGIQRGRLEFAFQQPPDDPGPRGQVDLSGAETVADVVNILSAAIETYEAAHGITILGPGGVSTGGRGVSIDVAAGAPGEADPILAFHDIGGGTTSADLGLSAFTPADSTGEDLQPRLTWRTPIDALAGVDGPLGAFRITSLGHTREIDLSNAATLEDIKNRIEGSGLGIRVELNEARSGLNIINEVAGTGAQAMAIEELPGGNMTATRLGIRSLSTYTRTSDFNDGRGIRIVTGSTDPVTGEPDPARDVDFTIRLGDAAQTTFGVNLRPQDMATVETVLARINEAAAAEGINIPADFEAALSDGANGIVLRQNGAFGEPITVSGANNSPAARDLGLVDGVWDAQAGTFRAQDRAKVRVDNLFAHLMDLRDSLQKNDTSGITLAGERLEQALERLSETRAQVGGYGRRVQDATRQQEDQTVLDETSRSLMQDVDFTEAAVRLNALQVQLHAAMLTASQSLSRSLLDFLG